MLYRKMIFFQSINDNNYILNIKIIVLFNIFFNSEINDRLYLIVKEKVLYSVKHKNDNYFGEFINHK